MIRVCIQGLGFVGSAMAAAVASAKDQKDNFVYEVIGVELPSKAGQMRVDSINNGKFPFSTDDNNLKLSLKKAKDRGNLYATTESNCYAEAKVVVVDIHLDIPYLDEAPKLEFKGFISAIKTIGREIRPGTLVLIETTVPPGTCEKIVVPTLESELIKRRIDPKSIYVAHSYERVMPGKNYLKSITDYWRVFSGHTKEAGDVCEVFLSNIINIEDFPLTRLSSTNASETAKVMENTYRAMNIAFIDEWTKYSESIGIDLFEVIKAIGKRPSHSNIRFPGLGVGGYCLTKDPTFAPAAAKQLFDKDLHFPFSQMAVKTNNEMPLHTVKRLKSLINNNFFEKKILICGVSYRQDIGDSRFSPSEILVNELVLQGAKVDCHDPYLSYWDELEFELLKDLPDPSNYDAAVFTVPHKQYKDLDLASWGNQSIVILDANGVFNNKKRALFRLAGINIESIGVGNGL
jgi:UDP-N-acetyl-D-glucosamine dehydrogenase